MPSTLGVLVFQQSAQQHRQKLQGVNACSHVCRQGHGMELSAMQALDHPLWGWCQNPDPVCSPSSWDMCKASLWQPLPRREQQHPCPGRDCKQALHSQDRRALRDAQEEGAVLGGHCELHFSPVSQQSSGCPACPPQPGLVELSGALCVK